MKELSTTIILRNGEPKLITVKLEDELANWLVTQPEDVYRDFIIFEFKSNCVERKETRRTQSLNASLSNGFDLIDESAESAETIVERLTVREAIKKLLPQQQWVAEQVLLLGRKQVDVARELGISKPAMTQQISIIKRDLKKILKKF